MPIWLRNFTFIKIQNFYENENAEAKKGKGSSSKSITTDGKVTSPEFLKNINSPPSSTPNYTTKASRK